MDAEATVNALKLLTDEMLVAAGRQDFEALLALGEQYAPLARQLLAERPSLPPELAAAVRQIISNQEEIARNTTPWIDDARKLLRESRQEQAVLAAYQSVP
jgi:ribosomal 50S subunit-associated protein YjgA (DUF615 family)